MKLVLVLSSLVAFLLPSALAGFFSDDTDAFGDESFGVGGIGGSGFGGPFANDDLLDRDDWKGKNGRGDGKYYVKSWSHVESKGYPKQKAKKVANDKKKWEASKGDGGEKKESKSGGQANKDEPFGKEFDEFVGVD